MTKKENINTNSIIYDTENSIVFEDYFDLILNKNKTFHDAMSNQKVTAGKTSIIWENATKLEQYEFLNYSEDINLVKGKPQQGAHVYTGGLLLPKQEKSADKGNGVKQKKSAGSGNILILGNPGAGKSTLAIQIAAACASETNGGISVYYSLEVDPKEMISNMFYENSDECNDQCITLKPWFYLPENEDDELSSENLCKRLRNVLSGGAKDEKIKPQILFPSMTPRGLGGFANEHRLYVDRYTELKLMAKAIKKYNEEATNTDEPIIKVVVIDSINAFGDCPLSREELYRLFDLFHQYGILGVFTLEKNELKSENKNQLTSETAKYMSDVVISLDKGLYNDYTCLYLEVEKSRYVTQVIGKHPYKITGLVQKNNKLNLRKRIEIIPSLHYRIFASETKSPEQLQKSSMNHEKEASRKNDKTENDKVNNIFGIAALSKILPNHFENRNMNIPQIITIKGNAGIYKSDIAFNAVLNGMLTKDCCGEYENGLLIRMNDRSLFSTNGMRLNVEMAEKICSDKSETDLIDVKEYKITLYEKKNLSVQRLNMEHKYSSKGWALNKEDGPLLIEVVFKSGALLPEEFIEEVCRIIKKFKVKRVAFSDIKAIGVSYPFLINSKTSGSIFLSAFIHIMRNYGVHVIMSCSSSGYQQSDDELLKACILSDAVISLEQKEDGEIIIEGEGSITSQEKIVIGLSNPEDTDKEKTKKLAQIKYSFLFVQMNEGREEELYRTNPLSSFSIKQIPVTPLLNKKDK
jgi:KaiC/GvpD/RAD55 family RecA-like ATPase